MQCNSLLGSCSLGLWSDTGLGPQEPQTRSLSCCPWPSASQGSRGLQPGHAQPPPSVGPGGPSTAWSRGLASNRWPSPWGEPPAPWGSAWWRELRVSTGFCGMGGAGQTVGSLLSLGGGATWPAPGVLRRCFSCGAHLGPLRISRDLARPARPLRRGLLPPPSSELRAAAGQSLSDFRYVYNIITLFIVQTRTCARG